MSQEHGNGQTDGMPDEGKQALSVLRGVWDARDQTSKDLDEACGNTKACGNMANVGFQGLADGIETPTRHDSSVGVNNDLRSAWKTQLEREGKFNTGAKSVRDLIMGSSDRDQ